MHASGAPAPRLILVLWSCGPDNPRGATLAAAPFVYALAARALDVDVEMHFTSSAVRWLFQGVGDAAYTDQGRTKTVSDYLRETQAMGVKHFACAMALHEHRRDETLIAGVGVGGAATVMGGAIEGSRVLIF